MQSLELKIPPVVLVILIAGLMWTLGSVFSDTAFHHAWSTAVATGIGGIGLVVSLLGVLAFRRANTTVDPRVPDQTTSLVSSGIYRLSRNPMYLGFLLTLIGWGIYISNTLALVCPLIFVLYMNRFQIDPEERYMLQKFGSEYRIYMRKVRRWL